ncbi:DNA primase [Hoylesella nanceiensis]|uniref:DNA primase n=2 Tax=Hoylesella nanceiensis TaxID=425941 RepID=A0ABS6YD65_9BACT|nr:DNA primase [Hoylesella nanceiensis]MBF1427053.1 DNA primase [Hoylesella nanceiensis]MBW4769509.1 DNA primase [Hoylesella nanceiensis]
MIDRLTVEKIKDAANIVDVVSEFVSLRRSGANYKGLCPFHNERTPSFFVSPSRGICHCFSCGRGGTPINFIMEHEQMTYVEALRWLARKYNIEIKERELTDKERQEQSERDSMFIVNEWAADYFKQILLESEGGNSIGLQYFRSRGFRDDIISKFHLGYDVQDRHQLAREAQAKGYQLDFLLKTGICYKNDRSEYIDRYAGRVIFPWLSVSGKIVGFGGRLLDSRTKGVAQKYVNSPDSEIYHKDQLLYGIYQAKKAISREDRVYMVEGYTDVISMHQCGIENVVANSGTALSVHQIRMLHRFTSNITLLYDGDAAGIHAALRGTDMILAEGMNIKVLVLPDGDDPDSFARKHSSADFKQYIEDHQVDFIQFKTNLMLNGVTDPAKRSEAINSIVQSIAVVPNQILRDTYIHDCAQRLNIAESTLINTMNKFIREAQDRMNKAPNAEAQQANSASATTQKYINNPSIPKVETMLMQVIIRHGDFIIYRDIEDEEGNLINLTVAEWINYSLSAEKLRFSVEIYNRVLNETLEHLRDNNFSAEQYFIHHNDIEISQLATELILDKYQYIREQKEESTGKQNVSDEARMEKETEKLRNEVLHLLLDFHFDLLERRLQQIKMEITQPNNTPERMASLMKDFRDTQQKRNELAQQRGNNIIR